MPAGTTYEVQQLNAQIKRLERENERKGEVIARLVATNVELTLRLREAIDWARCLWRT